MAQTAEGNQLSAEERKRMCSNKRRFGSESAAIMSAIDWQRRGVLSRGRVYRCTVCTKWHITSQTAGTGRLASGTVAGGAAR
jgi:hypothetical protein